MNGQTAAPDATARPRLRKHVSAEPADGGVVIYDPLRVGQPVAVTRLGLELARRFDGSNTLREVQLDVMRLTGGAMVPLDTIAALATALDEAFLLDSPRYAARVNGPIRQPACIGAYDGDPLKLRKQLADLFTAPNGPGLPTDRRDSPGRSREGSLRAVLVPHMDYARGNVTYGWGFKELVDRTDATVFVIVATAHYSLHRFTLTRQNFATPLGVVDTDQAYIDCLEREYGAGLFDDPDAHLPEHSIELEVVLLQYVLAQRRPFRIVPLLVGSFGDCVESGTLPSEQADIGRMIAALRKAEAACPDEVCYLISGDLAHIGPKFGDRSRAEEPWMTESRQRDERIVADLNRADPAAYFRTIAEESDRRRICGLPPTVLTLETIRPKRGAVLHYQQYVHPQGHESVSFAAAAFSD